MKSTIQVLATNFKDILFLFSKDTTISAIVLGDTCHPSSGYITERYIGEIHTVSDLLNFEYEFPCLVEFCARIGSTVVEKIGDSEDRGKYQIVAPSKEIRRIESAIIEKCAEDHTLYQYQIDW